MQEIIEPQKIIAYFYPVDTPMRQLLLKHSEQVRDKALRILADSKIEINPQIVILGAMLHDIGIGECDAPDIFCNGNNPYIKHGIIGARKLREYGEKNQVDLELLARICERHTGSGLTSQEIQRQNLPLPLRDFLPETPVEKLICLADKFFSKSGDGQEKTISQIQKSMAKFGPESLQRFNQLCLYFNLACFL